MAAEPSRRLRTWSQRSEVAPRPSGGRYLLKSRITRERLALHKAVYVRAADDFVCTARRRADLAEDKRHAGSCNNPHLIALLE